MAAAEWGCKPWEVLPGDDDELAWYLRWSAYREQLATRSKVNGNG